MLIAVNEEFARIAHSASLVSVVKQILEKEQCVPSEAGRFFSVGISNDQRVKFIELLGLDSNAADPPKPREILRGAVTQNVDALILCQTRTSENCLPNPLDVTLTKSLIAGSDILGLSLLDHIILDVGSGAYFSCRDQLPKSKIHWPEQTP